jgi:ornithine cyclodeaminase
MGEVLAEEAPPKRDPAVPTAFSPFGLGILDLAVARLALARAAAENLGTILEDFLPVADPLGRRHP